MTGSYVMLTSPFAVVVGRQLVAMHLPTTAAVARLLMLLSVSCFRFSRGPGSALASSGAIGGSSSSACPRTCFCNPMSYIVYCSRKGMTVIPEGIPAETLQLNLNGNAFSSGIVGRSNFSRYVNLQHLYMSECGLEQLQVDTFVDLVELRWLDLSNNRLKVITDNTFRGLTLDHLFLNGNRQIQLEPGSFEGLVTAGLYLHDCSIKSIRSDVLAPLNVTLRNLWLNGNELDRLDKSLSGIFSSLQHLRLGSNPLHCGCEAVWLMEFYERNADDVFKEASQPSCAAPSRLRGRHFNELSLTDFRCQAPVFNNIDIMLSETSGRLKCSATGDPAPTLFWIQPNGRTTKYGPRTHQPPVGTGSASSTAGANADADGTRRTDGVLLLKPDSRHNVLPLPQSSNSAAVAAATAAAAAMGASGSSLSASGTIVGAASGMYICIANNEAGNVTLAVNVSWPQFSNAYHTQQQQQSTHHRGVRPTSSLADGHNHRFPVSMPPHQSNDNDRTGANWTSLGNVDGIDEQLTDPTSGTAAAVGRLFSVPEMICAVVVTHVGTLIVSVLLVAGFVRRRTVKLRRQQQLLPSMHVGIGTAAPMSSALSGPSSAAGLGTMSASSGPCMERLMAAGAYRLPSNVARPVPTYAADYAVYDNTQSRRSPAANAVATATGTSISPFSYHIKPSGGLT